MNQAGTERLDRWLASPGDQTPLSDPEQDFQSRIYRDPTGRVAIHRDMVLGALKVAGRSVKLGRTAISHRDNTTLPSILRVRDEWILIDGGQAGTDPKFVRDIRWASARRAPKEPRPRVTGDGHRVAEMIGPRQKPVRIVRPKIMAWGFSLTLEVSGRSFLSIARKLFAVAGSEAGLGDFRPGLPNNSGWKSPFGRFEVDSWEEDDTTETEAAKVVYEMV